METWWAILVLNTHSSVCFPKRTEFPFIANQKSKMDVDGDTALCWDILKFEIPRHLALDISRLNYASTCHGLYQIKDPLVRRIPKNYGHRSITKTELKRFPNIVSLHVEENNLSNEDLVDFPQLRDLSIGARSFVDDRIFEALPLLRNLTIYCRWLHINDRRQFWDKLSEKALAENLSKLENFTLIKHGPSYMLSTLEAFATRAGLKNFVVKIID